LPELPPVADLIPGFDLVTPIGVFARAGTPDPIIRKIADAIIAVMKQPDIKPPFAALGMEPVGEGPEQFAQAVATEIVNITKMVESAGLKLK
jgi:tripartite-type tricarboxylate transporter receptor subunit TctC